MQVRETAALTTVTINPVWRGPWGDAVKYLREARGLTRGQVASRAHITATIYGRVERGAHTKTSTLQKIAEVFDVPIEAVLVTLPLPFDPRVTHTAPVVAAPHADRFVSPPSSAEYRDLQQQIARLHSQLAKVLADQEVARRERAGRERVPTARDRKPGRRPRRRKVR